MEKITAVYARFGKVEFDSVDSIEDGIALLEVMAEENLAYPLGVYDKGSRTIYITENMDVASRSREEIFSNLDDLRIIGVDPKRIKTYSFID